MSAPADVLAVLQTMACEAKAWRNGCSGDSLISEQQDKAIAAVAELVERDNRCRSAQINPLAVLEEFATRKNPFGNVDVAVQKYEQTRAAIAELLGKANLCAMAATPADDSTNDGLYVVRARYVHELRAALRACGGA